MHETCSYLLNDLEFSYICKIFYYFTRAQDTVYPYILYMSHTHAYIQAKIIK